MKVPNDRLSQHPLSMDHGGNGDLLKFNGIDGPVAVGYQLAGVFIVELRHFAARSWEASQSSGCPHNGPDHSFCVGCGVECDVSGNRFKRRQARRPDYSVSHWLSRFSTASCESVPIRLASSSPALRRRKPKPLPTCSWESHSSKQRVGYPRKS